MDNVWIVVITSLISGLVATIVTIIYQRVSESRKDKKEIFKVLMSHRYLISDKDNVEALNRVEVVFYKNKEVRECWKKFLSAADDAAKNPNNPSNDTDINDKYLKLLEEIAKCTGCKGIDWENIKKYYYPQGLSSKILEETALRRAQISQASAVAQQDQGNRSQMTAEEVGMRFMLKAMESPNGVESIAKIIELSGKGSKK